MTVQNIQPANPKSGRFFVRSFVMLTGNRWDPLFYEHDLYHFVRSSQSLVRLGDHLKAIRTGFAAGKTAQSNADGGIIQIRPTNLSENHELVFMRNVYIDRLEAIARPLDLLQRSEILFNNTNSQALVGKTVIFDLPGEFVASNHITRLRTNDKLLRADFLVCLLNIYHQYGVFFRLCTNWNNQSGVGPDVLRRVLIPSIDLKRQEEIAARWNQALAQRKKRETQASQLLATIDDVLLDELGIPRQPELPNTLESRIFKSSFATLTGQRWDPLYHQADIFAFVRDAKCGLQRLGGKVNYFITGFPAGRSDQVDEDDGGIIQLRPTNLSDDRELVFKRNVYIAASELKTRKADVLKRGEALFNNTNSQEQVGKTVWFDLEGDYFSSNHITRIGTKTDELNPQYLAYILNLYQRRKVLFRLCTNWNNQSGVGSDILQRIPIPLPKPARQAEIVKRLESVRAKARALREQARADFEEAKRDIEAMILGKEIAE
ncbi:MAG: restriction endonuclease subunit S [Candidatus Competibacter sp.]